MIRFLLLIACVTFIVIVVAPFAQPYSLLLLAVALATIVVGGFWIIQTSIAQSLRKENKRSRKSFASPARKHIARSF